MMEIIKRVVGDTYKVKEDLKKQGFKYSNLYGWNTKDLSLNTEYKTEYEYIDVDENDFEEILKLEFTPERIAELKEINWSALMFIKRGLSSRIAAKNDINKLLDELNSPSTVELLKKILK